MREDIIIKDAEGNPVMTDGRESIDFSKAIGKCYGNGFFTNCHARYRVYEGARNTKKSYDMIGYEPVIKIVMCPLRNVVILRQNDVDNRQSTFEQICSAISDLGFDGSFIVRKTPLEIEYAPTGQKIIFRGLNNPTSLNSIKFKVGYWTDTYIEEAFEVSSYDDFRKIDGSMRGKLPPGYFFQITLCLNAWSQDTWIYAEFFQHRLEDDYARLDAPETKFMDFEDPDFIGPFGKGLYLHKSTYKCNEFRDPSYDDSAAAMRARAPEIYKVEYLGMWGNATEAVYPEFNDSLIKPIQHFTSDESYYSFAIGIDTGLSDGQGGKRIVRKGESASDRVKSATAMILGAVSADFERMCFIDEYFHSNSKAVSYFNTDGQDPMTQPQLVQKCVSTIKGWIIRYADVRMLMKGSVKVYIDCADLGFRQSLDMEAERQGLMCAQFYGSTKLPIQSRVDFHRLMMAYGDWNVCDSCKNLIRETRNSRRGERGEAREDGDDHAENAAEYAITPLLGDLRRWKTFKIR